MSVRPMLEELESRDVPATTEVFLDFSWNGYTIKDEFRFANLDYPRRRNPYDFNRDGRSNLRDLRLLVPRLVAECDRILPPQVIVSAVDVFSDAGVGERILRERSGYVIKVGGYTDDHATGQAWLAGPGENVAGSGFLFSGAVLEACYYQRLSPWWRIRSLAATAAHEWGHLIGLVHTTLRDEDIMSPFLRLGRIQSFQPEHQQEIDRSWAEPFRFVDYGPG